MYLSSSRASWQSLFVFVFAFERNRPIGNSAVHNVSNLKNGYYRPRVCSFCWNFDSFQVNSQKLGVQAPQNVEFE